MVKPFLRAMKFKIAKEEKITVKVVNTNTNCYNESTFKLIVSPVPAANSLQELIGCDDNNDGISEYFDSHHVMQAMA